MLIFKRRKERSWSFPSSIEACLDSEKAFGISITPPQTPKRQAAPPIKITWGHSRLKKKDKENVSGSPTIPAIETRAVNTIPGKKGERASPRSTFSRELKKILATQTAPAERVTERKNKGINSISKKRTRESALSLFSEKKAKRKGKTIKSREAHLINLKLLFIVSK